MSLIIQFIDQLSFYVGVYKGINKNIVYYLIDMEK